MSFLITRTLLILSLVLFHSMKNDEIIDRNII